MCLASFLIYENCSALEISELTDENVMQYIEENYSDYFSNYTLLIKGDTKYFFISCDNNFYLDYNGYSWKLRLSNPEIKITYNTVILDPISNSVFYQKKGLTVNAGSNGTTHTTFNTLDIFYYSNFDVYSNNSGTISENPIFIKNYPIESEPEPELPPEPSEPSDEEGGVSAYDITSVYMKYFLMCLPVGLVMVSIEKLLEIFHNFVLGKMRK